MRLRTGNSRQYVNVEKNVATIINFDAARRRKLRAASDSCVARPPYPQVTKGDPLLVALSDGTVIRTRLGDLTCDGVKLRTDRATAGVLHPSGCFINSDNAPKVQVYLDLPLPGGELRVGVRCRIARFEQVSQDEVTFTLHFLSFEGAGAAVIRHYVKISRAADTRMSRRKANVETFNPS